MIVTTYGTRGSLPVADRNKIKHGGNTTCIGVESKCLPSDMALCIDAGTGFLPFSKIALEAGMKRLVLLHTHYHHDHTQGMLIAPPVYMDSISIEVFGPVEKSVGPREVYEKLMDPPIHPVAFGAVSHHLSFHKMENPSTKIIVTHPKGGVKMIDIEQYKKNTTLGKHIPFGSGAHFPIEECLVISMHLTDHPERTVAYRFDDKPLGKSFVFLTDEEVRASIPLSLKNFVHAADLLVQDAQYSKAIYETKTAGFGHGTPEYVVRLATECGVKRVGITHHDPLSSDADIEALVQEGCQAAQGRELEFFACCDYQSIEV